MEPIQQSFDSVSKWIGRNSGLIINWHKGSEVSADVKSGRINIPIVSSASEFDEKVLKTLRARVYHECGHIAFSQHIETDNEVLFGIYNAVEDVRIEQKTAKMGLGIRKTFLEENTRLLREHGNRFVSEPDASPPHVQALFYMMGKAMNISPLWKLTPKTQALYDAAWGFFSGWTKAKNGGDCFDIAEKIYKVWESEINKSQSQTGAKTGKPDKDKDVPSIEARGQTGANTGKPDKDKDVPSIEVRGFYQDAEEKIKEEVSRLQNIPYLYTAYSAEDVHEKLIPLTIHNTAYNQFFAKMARTARSLMASAEQAFISSAQSQILYGMKGGEIDYGRLPDIAFNLSEEVFTQQTEGVDINTAVAVLVDLSGSMWKTMRAVQAAVMVLGELFNYVDIPFSVIGTTTTGNGIPRDGFVRWQGMKFIHVKDFDDDWNRQRGASMMMTAQNNNLDGEGLSYVFDTLNGRDEKRKIIFSICDGLPEGGQEDRFCQEYYNTLFAAHLQKTVEKIRGKGTEVYSIAIGTDKPQDFYGKDSIVIRDSDNLVKELIASVVTKVSPK